MKLPFNEPIKIVLRRFIDKSVESGLLIIAIALGIGAFSAGLSLIMNTISFSNEIMSSPEYKELVVSTRSQAGDMDVPVKEKLVSETAILTTKDLEAADIAPNIEWAYIQNRSMIFLVSANSTDNGFPENPPPPEAGGSPPADNPEQEKSSKEAVNAPPNFNRISDAEIAEASLDDNIILSDLERVSGYEVSPQFFNSWNISTQAGSLFAQSDMSGTDNLIVLGSNFAELLAGDKMKTSDLIGKKLLERRGYQTIIGVLNPVSDDFDSNFFKPYREDNGGLNSFRRMFMNTELRFAVSNPEELDSTEDQLQKWFNSQFGSSQIVISNPRAEAKQLVDRNTGIGILIMFLAAAGFFIALLNVSNILMSRVLRMKKNVGILMALGASRKKIRNLFLFESLLLAILGGLAGIIFAIPLSNYMEAAAGLENSSWIYTAIGTVLAGALSFIFGLLPSHKFMKIQPAEAMRKM